VSWIFLPRRRSAAAGGAVSDPFYSSTTLITTGAGTPGATITDFSPLANTLTATGAATNSGTGVGTEATSVYYGTSVAAGQIQIASGAATAWDFAGADFTIEVLGIGGSGGVDRHFFDAWSARFLLRHSGTDLQFFTNFSSPMFNVSLAWAVGSLRHVAVVRSGNNWGIWNNGTSLATTTDASSISSTAVRLLLSTNSNGSTTPGNWNHRITKAARWTPGVGFTHPTFFPTS
jgi:hypothetical protein